MTAVIILTIIKICGSEEESSTWTPRSHKENTVTFGSSVHMWVTSSRCQAMCWTLLIQTELYFVIVLWVREGSNISIVSFSFILVWGTSSNQRYSETREGKKRDVFPFHKKRKRAVNITEDLRAVGNSAIYRMLKKATKRTTQNRNYHHSFPDL